MPYQMYKTRVVCYFKSGWWSLSFRIPITILGKYVSMVRTLQLIRLYCFVLAQRRYENADHYCNGRLSLDVRYCRGVRFQVLFSLS